ncbi:Quinolinate synthase A [bacterium HR19]|nr:Quinolinate synthase A [bacterium HR19]
MSEEVKGKEEVRRSKDTKEIKPLLTEEQVQYAREIFKSKGYAEKWKNLSNLFLKHKEERNIDIKEIQQEIIKLKKEKEALILAHNYMLPEIQEIADFVGDSLELAIKAAENPQNLIVFCGVHFMAEGVKVVSPEKTVLLPRLEAGCFMADMINISALRKFKEKYPGRPVVCYINTDAAVKAESDICCTSANAVQIVKSVNSKEVLFIPDRNLGLYVQRFTEQKIIPWDGWCNVHHRFRPEDIKKVRENHPDAVIVVHPECSPEVIDLADEVFSTGGMVRFARETKHKKIAIATEEGLVERIRRENPDKIILSVGSPKTCVNMKSIRIQDVLQSLKEMKYKIEVPEDIIERARVPLIRMLELSKGKEFVKRIFYSQYA